MKDNVLKNRIFRRVFLGALTKNLIHHETEDDFGFRQQEIEIIFRLVGKIE